MWRAVLFAAFAASLAAAQVDTGKPITLKPPRVRLVKFKAEVLHANNIQITVRDRGNGLIVRTFRYTEKVRDAMQKIIDRGGYQHGDKVEIHYAPGSDVAVKIKGKPSKPL